jgi:dynein light chain LC8-type
MSTLQREESSRLKAKDQAANAETTEVKSPIVQFYNVNTDVKEHCFKIAEDTLQLYIKEEIKYFKIMAEKIKMSLDKRFGASWHVVVGIDFGSFVSFEKGCAIMFQLNNFSFLIWKHA